MGQPKENFDVRKIVDFLIAAGYELGNLDGTQTWGWDGLTHAKALCDHFGLDYENWRENAY